MSKSKKSKYRNVSEKMGLPRLEKATPRTCLDRANKIVSLIEKNKIQKNLIPTAMRWVYTYRSRAKQLKAA